MADNIEIAEMSWEQVDEACKARPVALIPVGATEAHGPHLPLSADTVIAIEMSRRGAVKLKEHNVPALILPPVNYVVADFGADFAGNISLPAETATTFLRDLGLAVARSFRAAAFVNVHLEPAHLECLKKAVDDANKAGGKVCWVDITRKRWAQQLGEPFLKGDHGGAWETSLVMAARKELVDDSVRINLAPMDGLLPAMRKGAKTFKEAGGEEAYFGDPTAANVEDGETYFESLAEVLSTSVMEYLGSKA